MDEKPIYKEMVLDESQFLETLEPNMNLFSRITHIFFAPKKVFKDVDVAPKVLMPMLIIFVLGILVILPNFDALVSRVELRLLNQGGEYVGTMTPDEFGQTARVATYFSVFAYGLGALLYVVINALIIKLITAIAGGKSTFKRLLSAFLYTQVVLLLGQLVIFGLTYIFNHLLNGMFITESRGAFGLLMTGMNIFTIWHIILNIIAVQILEEFKPLKASICVLTPNLLLFFLSFFL